MEIAAIPEERRFVMRTFEADTEIVDAVRDAETPKELCSALHSLASAIGTGKIHYTSVEVGVRKAVDEIPSANVELALILQMKEPKNEKQA